MSLRPTVALHGALPALQPEYYYSDIFIAPLRLDIETLLINFVESLHNSSDHDGAHDHSSNTTGQNGMLKDDISFATFKRCWVSSDWNFMHLRCLDPIGRAAFLHVLHRIFLEAALAYSDTLMRLGALYGLYTLHMTQPEQLHEIPAIPVPLDHLQQLFQLPLNFQGPRKLVATHLITTLISRDAFRLLPVSGLRPLNPTVLPQTFVTISTTDQDPSPRGPGRVTLPNRLRTARRAVDELQTFLDGDSPHMTSGETGPLPSFADYINRRTHMINSAGAKATSDAIQETSQNLQNAEAMLVREGVPVEVDPELRSGYLLRLVRRASE